MNFDCNGTTLNVYRHSYHFYDPRDGKLPVSGDWVVELYYNFDDPDIGWGSVGGEYLFWRDIAEWLQGMEKVEQGKLESFEKIFYYRGNDESYFLKLILEAVADEKMRLQLSISDGLTEDYIDIDQLFSKEEWKTYSDEFRTWNEIFPFQLGDHVRVVKYLRDAERIGKVGIVSQILVSDYLGHSAKYVVEVPEKGWNGPYWDGFVCKPDEIELVKRDNANCAE